MAAPTPSDRQNPAGIKLKDGYQILITPESNPTIEFWEKAVKPPGFDGGEMIPQTTMHNTAWRTFAPRSLKTATDMTGRAAYDPKLLDSISALINVEDVYTVTFANGDQWCMFAALRLFDPQEVTEGNQPEALFTISPTNVDFENSDVEAGPNYVSAAGTD